MPQEQFKFPSLIKRVDSSTPLPDKKQRLIYDAYVRKAQEQDSLGKKIGRGAVDSVAGLIQGLFGLDDGTSPLSINNPADVGKGIGSVLTAGLPFHAITRGKPVFHGTGKVFDRFDPGGYDRVDTLGRFTHFAERPDYASSYALGDMKINRGDNPNIIPAYLEAKNTLDITRRHVPEEDVEAFFSGLEDSTTKNIIKRVYSSQLRNPEDTSIGVNRAIQSVLHTQPDVIERTPFDAIRYNDGGDIAWAVPDKTPIKTPWGVDMSVEGQRDNFGQLVLSPIENKIVQNFMNAGISYDVALKLLKMKTK